MTGRALAILACIVLIGAAIATYFIAGWPTALEDQDSAQAIVEEFGTKMQNVSVLADATLASDAIAREYGSLITVELLSRWQSDPSQAPGRLTSSPWPHHIEIKTVDRESRGRYVFEGDIVEFSNEGGSGIEPKEAIRRPATFVVEKKEGSWRISEVVLGVYPGEAQWIGSLPTDQGFLFQYPERIPTTFVMAQEWPPYIEQLNSAYSCTEYSGPAGEGAPQRLTAKHMVGDREYCVTTSREGAAGSVFESYEYTFTFGGETYRTSFTLRKPECANYAEPQQSACKAEQASFSVDTLVDRITQSIQLVPLK